MKSINLEKICIIAQEITDRNKLILDLFPKDNKDFLKHLAASSIHMAMFMRDLVEISNGEKTFRFDKEEKQFLENCGCDFNKDKN